MDAIVIEAKTKKDAKFWLDLARKVGSRAKFIKTDEIEDKALATLIEKGMKTPNVSRDSVLKALK